MEGNDLPLRDLLIDSKLIWRCLLADDNNDDGAYLLFGLSLTRTNHNYSTSRV